MKKILCFASLLLMFSLSASAQKMKVEDIISKHLSSIATADIIASTKNVVVVGEVEFTTLTQKSPTILGKAVLASEGNKSFFGISLNSLDYSQEKIIFDGKNSSVGFAFQGKYSTLGNYLLSNKEIVHEGLFGGVLSTNWTFTNAKDRKSKISFDGTKKIDGKETYVLDYLLKTGSGSEIKLYFDKETFSHVRTVYSFIRSASQGLTPDQSSRMSETRIKFTEDFSEFKKFGNYNLPQKYKINYSVISQNSSTEAEWVFRFGTFSFNQKLDEKTFMTN
jgi:hypothetical protein